MNKSNKLHIGLYYLLGGLVLMGVMGGPCDITISPDGIITFDSVTVELVNNTDYPIEPYLFVDEDENVSVDGLVVDENFVALDPLLQPDEIIELAFDCDEIGSIISDRAWLVVSDTEIYESDNGPLLREEDDFECGDVISFIFIDEGPEGSFFTRVEVNNQFVED